MSSRYSDAEQVDALKEWWKENGQSIIAGVVIGVGGLLGWKGWSAWQQNQAESASTQYASLQKALSTKNTVAVNKASEVLRESYSSTPYAAMAALTQAQMAAEGGDSNAAVSHLQWVIDNAEQESVAQLARIRLARVLVAIDEPDRALELLDSGIPQSYASLASEIRGDALLAKGQTEKAREAYDQALIGAQGQTRYLRMKRDELVTGQSDAQPPSTDSS